MNEPLKYFIESNTPQIEEMMFALVEQIDAPADLKESMLYSLKAGVNEFVRFCVSGTRALP